MDMIDDINTDHYRIRAQASASGSGRGAGRGHSRDFKTSMGRTS